MAITQSPSPYQKSPDTFENGFSSDNIVDNSIYIKQWKDFNFNFNRHPMTKKHLTVKNEEAIKQHLRSLFQLDYYSKPFHPEIGTPIRKLLFEPWTPLIKSGLKKIIDDMVINYEPRVKLLNSDIQFNHTDQHIEITLYLLIKQFEKQIQFKHILSRVR